MTVVLLLVYPGLRSAMAAWPPPLLRLADLLVLSAPLLAGVVVAGRVAADGIGRATGIRRWRWPDAALGVFTALVVRALVELVQPTTGTLLGPLEAEPEPDVIVGAVVLVVGLVLVSPLVEELFFRGLVLRALVDGMTPAGRVVASLVALLVSTGAFAALHLVPWTGGVPSGLIVGTVGVGLGCGILTLVTGRLGAAVIAHVTANAIGVGLLIF